MRDRDKNNYFFLNREGRWPGFQRDGLELGKDGALRLSSLPSFSGTLPEALKTAPEPDGPAGLAVDRYGAIYFSDPDHDRVWRIDACDGSAAPLPCLGGSGAQNAQLSHPRGLLIPHGRNSLFVADSGNHRIQVFDLGSLELVQIWGQSNLGGEPQPGSAPSQFNTPWTLAGDSENNVYVVDYNNQRVQKFNAIGAVVPAFWDNMHASSQLQQPSDIAVREQDGSVWIFVLDASQAKVFVFDKDGNPVRDSAGEFLAISVSQKPMGLAAAGNSFYISDNDQRRIFRFQFGEKAGLVGEALGYQGPVAALLLDGKGGLLVHPGGNARPVLLQAEGGCRAQGVLWNIHPIQVEDRKVAWHRLQALLEPLAKNAHLDLFAYTTCKKDDAPAVKPGEINPFADPRWKSADYPPDRNIADLYIGGKEAKYLWLGALFLSDGSAGPVLKQLRVEFDYPTYDQFLPAIYRNQANCGEFLLRLLSLFESFNQEVEDEIAGIAALFDPQAVPAKFLAWLAGCLGLDLDQNWDEHKQRRIIAEIFRLSGRRGTAAGLRGMLRLFAGVDAVIEEPILHAAWWALPGSADSCCESCAAHAAAASEWQGAGDSILGWTTMLAPAQPQGAVVGVSSDLDQSHLITDGDFGAPLFLDTAYRFTVNVYRRQVMCEEALARIRAVLDQEKPAHTAYELCIIEPRFRVGFQGRVGIDTVVAGPQRSLVLEDDGQLLGEGTVLGGKPASYVGMEVRLGVSTRLS
jgi:phage tail-like protein